MTASRETEALIVRRYRRRAFAHLDVALTALHNAHRLLPPGLALESVRVAEDAVATADKVMRRKPRKKAVRP